MLDSGLVLTERIGGHQSPWDLRESLKFFKNFHTCASVYELDRLDDSMSKQTDGGLQADDWSQLMREEFQALSS